MKYDLIVLSKESLDSHPSVGVFFADGIYVFNIPDQTQRIFRENHIKFSKLLQIFVTSLSASAIGGFHGLTITVSDSNQRTVNFSGPQNFEHILDSYQYLHKNPNLRPKLIKNYSDKNINVIEHVLFRSVAFEVHLCDIPGKFLVNKAKDLGLKSGPIFRDLTSGKTVTLPDGRIITPNMVIGDPIPGDTLFLVDCTCQEDISALPNPSITKAFQFVVHFTKPEFLFLPEYLSHFDPNQEALCFSPTGSVTFSSIAALYANSAQFDQTIFPPLIIFESKIIDLLSQFHAHGFKKVRDALPSLDYAFCPVDKKKYIEPPPPEQVFTENLEIPLKNVDSFSVTFLGTGSMYPSKYRNVAGILIHTQVGYVILDAGEGFASQLRRRFGMNNFKEIMNNLLFIWISHLHGDHHFGLYQLLQERANVTNSIIPLICHDYIANHMENCQKYSGFGSLKFDALKINSKSLNGEFERNGVNIKYFPVCHCQDSLGCVLTLPGGWRIAYSGDRCPQDNFNEEVKNCDLLIHEATFSDELEGSAASKCHSTMGQALQTGKAVHATYQILTHFSQRYPRLPVFPEGTNNVSFAFDYMTIPFEKMSNLCSVCPKIFQMIIELEEKEEKEND